MAYIEQSAFMDKVVGLIFGHYAAEVPEDLLPFSLASQSDTIFPRSTQTTLVTVRHAIPTGMDATLDANAQTLVFEGGRSEWGAPCQIHMERLVHLHYSSTSTVKPDLNSTVNLSL